MEKENRNLLDQVMNAENVHNELEREIQRLSSLKKKVVHVTESNIIKMLIFFCAFPYYQIYIILSLLIM